MLSTVLKILENSIGKKRIYGELEILGFVKIGGLGLLELNWKERN